MSEGKLPIAWVQRPAPLAPLAAWIPNESLPRLRTREFSSEVSALKPRGGLIVMAKERELPWTPGIRYFGRDERAPALLLPTHSIPTLALELFERCVTKRCRFSGPILVDPHSRTLVGLSGARPLTASLLAALIAPASEMELPR